MFTCPCCGYAVFDEEPGSYAICPICFWEDDVFQLYYPHQSGGPNKCSLVEAQINFVQFGACERSMSKNVRAASDSDTRDSEWFPLWTRRIEVPDPDSDSPHPLHMTSKYDLYYWLRT